MRLTATSRRSSSSWARQTTPKPPAAELLEQAVALEHELVGVGSGFAARARDAPARGRIRGLVALAAGRLDEGLWRLHRLPRSPLQRPVPAGGGRKTPH